MFILAPILLLAGFLSGCSETEDVKRMIADSRCNGMICSVGVVDAKIFRTTDIIGRVREKVYNLNAINLSENCNIYWSVDDINSKSKYDMADHKTLADNSLDLCGNADEYGMCGTSSNPTGFIFKELGDYVILVNGYIMRDGGPINVNLEHHLNIKVGKPPITVNREWGMTYVFSADIDHMGIPDGSTYDWFIESSNNSTTNIVYSNLDVDVKVKQKHTFNDAGSYTFKLVVKNDAGEIITSSILDVDVRRSTVHELVATLKANVIGNKIIAEVDDLQIDNAKRSLEDIYNNVGFTWSIVEVDSSNNETDVPGAELDKSNKTTVKFSKLNYNTDYKVKLSLSYNGQSASA
ncbi:hypothetical protein QIW31_08920, partial [Francisellaceae bacterium CB299]